MFFWIVALVAFRRLNSQFLKTKVKKGASCSDLHFSYYFETQTFPQRNESFSLFLTEQRVLAAKSFQLWCVLGRSVDQADACWASEAAAQL